MKTLLLIFILIIQIQLTIMQKHILRNYELADRNAASILRLNNLAFHNFK